MDFEEILIPITIENSRLHDKRRFISNIEQDFSLEEFNKIVKTIFINPTQRKTENQTENESDNKEED